MEATIIDSTRLNSIIKDEIDVNPIEVSQVGSGLSPDPDQHSNPRTRKSLFEPWKCEVCELRIPYGQTWEQAPSHPLVQIAPKSR